MSTKLLWIGKHGKRASLTTEVQNSCEDMRLQFLQRSLLVFPKLLNSLKLNIYGPLLDTFIRSFIIFPPPKV